MKLFLIVITFFCSVEAISQELLSYSDTLNAFSISVPKDWSIQNSKTNGSGVKFIARAQNQDGNTAYLANLNVNLVPVPNSNIDSSYRDLKATISKRTAYEFINEGDTVIEGMKYKWLLQNHSNVQTAEPMTALILLGYKNGTGYMVTFASTKNLFANHEGLFRRIAATFRL